MTDLLNTAETGFAGFLKSWRARRRLSQLELSLESGMSQRHISFLETGRSKPSRFAIAQLAEALEMPAAEVDVMLLSAGFATRSSRTGWSDETRRAVDASIDHILESHTPFPAVCIDRVWNLIKANAAAQRFFQSMGSSGNPNLLKEIFSPGPVKDSIANWEETVRALFRLLELECARRPNDIEARLLMKDLRDLEDVAEVASLPSPEQPRPVLEIEFHCDGMILNLFSMIATIGMSADAAIDDLRIETLLPANDSTRDWFNEQFG